jgi:ectoine hydroxylase-related dioxygenase (phytanoyl-CoA dioxygenase family)
MIHSLPQENLLSKEKIDFYQENGFVQVDNVLSEDELFELRKYLEEAMNSNGSLSIQTDKKGGSYYRILNQKVNTWRDHAGMGKYVFHPRFAKMALELSGENGIRLFHDQALLKMPGDSKPTPWHQDFPYWPMNGKKDTKTLSIWVALDDVDENNGCMMFLPKSHRVGKLKPIDLVNPQDVSEFTKGTIVEDKQPVMVRMRAGSCTFHNGLTFHYAHANKTDRPRRALVMIYMPDETTYNGKPHPITDGLDLAKDQPLSGGLFPLLVKL